MPRILELQKAITEVTSEEQAKKLVSTWVSEAQAGELSKPGEGTKFCSLIAEFVVGFMTRKQANYGKLVTAPFKNPAKAETADDVETKIVSNKGQVMYCAVGGHEFAIVNDSGYYGLFQAWADEFEVFPKLNPRSMDHNIIGQGDATLRLIMGQLAHIKKKTTDTGNLDMRPLPVAS